MSTTLSKCCGKFIDNLYSAFLNHCCCAFIALLTSGQSQCGIQLLPMLTKNIAHFQHSFLTFYNYHYCTDFCTRPICRCQIFNLSYCFINIIVTMDALIVPYSFSYTYQLQFAIFLLLCIVILFFILFFRSCFRNKLRNKQHHMVSTWLCSNQTELIL